MKITLLEAKANLARLIKRSIRIEQVSDIEVDDEGNPVVTHGQLITILDGPLASQTLVMWRYQSTFAFLEAEEAALVADLFGITPEVLLASEKEALHAPVRKATARNSAIQCIWRAVLGTLSDRVIQIEPLNEGFVAEEKTHVPV